MKILIIKLGAMGDVLRTTPLLAALKRIHPGSRVTWIVDRESASVLEGNPLVHERILYAPEVLSRLREEEFDVALNLDKEPEALDCAGAARARDKKGFGWNRDHSGVAPLNPESRYAVRLGEDDEWKFRLNRKTYQEISFEQAGIPFGGEEYVMTVPDELLRSGGEHLRHLGLEPGTVGLNTGSGERFAGKKLPLSHLLEICRTFYREEGRPVVLLGGPREAEWNRQIERLARPSAVNAGTDHTIHGFAGIVSHLGCVITGDTLALHIAVACRVPVAAFFGSTSAPEIELYGRGRKIVSTLPCSPCYLRACPIDDQCMEELSVEDIVRAAREVRR